MSVISNFNSVKKLLVILVLTGWLYPGGLLWGQTVRHFSLEEAQQYAIVNSYTARNAQTDISIAHKQVDGLTATGLPQINGTISYTNFFELPVYLLPGEFFGQPSGTYVPIQFGTPHNGEAKVGLSQLIFSGTYFIGLKAARSFVELSRTTFQKTQNQIREDIANAYYNVILLQESKRITDSTLLTLKKMQFEMEQTYQSGFIENTDVDQIDLMVQDLETTQLNLTKQLEIAYNYLKFQMGFKISQPITLTDDLDKLIRDMDSGMLMASAFDYTQHVDYRLAQDQEVLRTMNMKVKKAAYLPTLSGFVSIAEDAQRATFDFFAPHQPWFRTSQFGITMDIPILSSGIRSSAVQQAKLELQKAQVQDEQVKEGLLLEYSTAKSSFNNAMQVFENKKKSADLANRIYNKTVLKYKEGMASSMDIQQSYNQYLSAFSSYILAAKDLLSSKARFEKVLTKIH
jgi:outer membrane protein